MKISDLADSALEYINSKRQLASSFMTTAHFDMELKIISESLASGRGEIFSVQGEKGNCCSVFLMKGDKKLFLLSSYSNKEARKKSAYFFVLDYIFSLKRFKGYVFDFEGSNIEGIAKRNAGFGANPTNFYTIRLALWNRILNLLNIR